MAALPNARHRDQRLRSLAFSLVTIGLAAACASGGMEYSWARPDMGPLHFRDVVTIAVTPSSARRRMMEEAMAGEIHRIAPNVQAVGSYTLIGDKDVNNESHFRDQINQAGFDGAVFLRVTDVTRQDVYIPGSAAPGYYRTFWGYYKYWTPIAFEPNYVERDTDVQVETEVYSTAGEGELVYSAISRAVDPTSPADLVRKVGAVVASDMKSRGLLRPGPGRPGVTR
jgi:hypothetical protein